MPRKTEGFELRIERDIAPLMKAAIAIPVGDPREGLAVYVSQSAFPEAPAADDVLRKIAKSIVRALQEEGIRVLT